MPSQASGHESVPPIDRLVTLLATANSTHDEDDGATTNWRAKDHRKKISFKEERQLNVLLALP